MIAAFVGGVIFGGILGFAACAFLVVSGKMSDMEDFDA